MLPALCRLRKIGPKQVVEFSTPIAKEVNFTTPIAK